MSGMISDWIIAMDRAGITDLAADFHTKKLEDDERLIKSCLPITPGFKLQYTDFSRDNKALMAFLAEHPVDLHHDFVTRAIPDGPDLTRRFKVPTKSYEEIGDFLRQEIAEGNEHRYSVFLTARETNRSCGVIISRDTDVMVEIGGDDLPALCHGEDPVASCYIDLTGVGHLENKMHWGIEGTHDAQRLVRRSLDLIELTRDSFNPHYRKGYFEFVVTEVTDRVLFVDYKVNPRYFL